MGPTPLLAKAEKDALPRDGTGSERLPGCWPKGHGVQLCQDMKGRK